MTTPLGSVFVGDIQRHRMLSANTPPASPPPGGLSQSPTAMSSVFAAQMQADGSTSSLSSARVPPVTATEPLKKPNISPELSLELRLRWLEAILLGVKEDESAKDKKKRKPLVKETEDIQKRLQTAVEANDVLKKFMEHYDTYAHLLTPAFALSGTVPSPVPSYEHLSHAELEAYLAEMEPDIKTAERGIQEIQEYESRGLLEAGKLADYELLQPRLNKLIQAHKVDLELAASLQNRITALMERHAIMVDTLSELFVAWDGSIADAEHRVMQLERQKVERQRLGYE